MNYVLFNKMDKVSICVRIWGCVLHNLACTVQPWVQTGMGQVFIFRHGGVVKYCASQNVTLAWLRRFDLSPTSACKNVYKYVD